jgi:hypothetical protein
VIKHCCRMISRYVILQWSFAITNEFAQTTVTWFFFHVTNHVPFHVSGVNHNLAAYWTGFISSFHCLDDISNSMYCAQMTGKIISVLYIDTTN